MITENNYNKNKPHNDTKSFYELKKEEFLRDQVFIKAESEKLSNEISLLNDNYSEIQDYLSWGVSDTEIINHFSVSQEALDAIKIKIKLQQKAVTGFSRLKDEDPREFDFVLPGIPKSYIGCVFSSGGVGKTTFMFQLGCQIASGVNMLGIETIEGKVCYMLGEDDEISVEHRMACIARLPCMNDEKKLKKLEENMLIIPMAGESKDLKSEETLKLIEDAATGRDLMVIDTWAAFTSGSDSNSSQETGEILQNLIQIGSRTKCAIIYINHTSQSAQKSNDLRLASANKGNGALIDNARIAWFLVKFHEEDRNKYEGGYDADENKYVCFGTAKVNLVEAYDQWYERVNPNTDKSKMKLCSHTFKPAKFVEIVNLPAKRKSTDFTNKNNKGVNARVQEKEYKE